jgi:hypothetical protein
MVLQLLFVPLKLLLIGLDLLVSSLVRKFTASYLSDQPIIELCRTCTGHNCYVRLDPSNQEAAFLQEIAALRACQQ